MMNDEFDFIDGQTGKEEFLNKYDWFDVDIEGNILDITKKLKKAEYTLSYRGSKFAPVCGIHALTGQTGNGKTMTFVTMMAALLKGEYGGITRELEQAPRILYIDTEQELANTQLAMLRLYEMMGWTLGEHIENREDVKVVCLREETEAKDRWRKTLKAIYQFRPDDGRTMVVFLDGLLDVIEDFNDNKECAEVIYNCMKVASHYGISLWCLVHENPGNNTKMVGHAGSMLARKVTDVFSTVKEKKGGDITFTITQKKARSKDVEDIKFHIFDGKNSFGIPVVDDSYDPREELFNRALQTLAKKRGKITWPKAATTIERNIFGNGSNTKNVDILIEKNILVEDGENCGSKCYNIREGVFEDEN